MTRSGKCGWQARRKQKETATHLQSLRGRADRLPRRGWASVDRQVSLDVLARRRADPRPLLRLLRLCGEEAPHGRADRARARPARHRLDMSRERIAGWAFAENLLDVEQCDRAEESREYGRGWRNIVFGQQRAEVWNQRHQLLLDVVSIDVGRTEQPLGDEGARVGQFE